MRLGPLCLLSSEKDMDFLWLFAQLVSQVGKLPLFWVHSLGALQARMTTITRCEDKALIVITLCCLRDPIVQSLSSILLALTSCESELYLGFGASCRLPLGKRPSILVILDHWDIPAILTSVASLIPRRLVVSNASTSKHALINRFFVKPLELCESGAFGGYINQFPRPYIEDITNIPDIASYVDGRCKRVSNALLTERNHAVVRMKTAHVFWNVLVRVLIDLALSAFSLALGPKEWALFSCMSRQFFLMVGVLELHTSKQPQVFPLSDYFLKACGVAHYPPGSHNLRGEDTVDQHRKSARNPTCDTRCTASHAGYQESLAGADLAVDMVASNVYQVDNYPDTAAFTGGYRLTGHAPYTSDYVPLLTSTFRNVYLQNYIFNACSIRCAIFHVYILVLLAVSNSTLVFCISHLKRRVADCAAGYMKYIGAILTLPDLAARELSSFLQISRTTSTDFEFVHQLVFQLLPQRLSSREAFPVLLLAVSDNPSASCEVTDHVALNALKDLKPLSYPGDPTISRAFYNTEVALLSKEGPVPVIVHDGLPSSLGVTSQYSLADVTISFHAFDTSTVLTKSVFSHLHAFMQPSFDFHMPLYFDPERCMLIFYLACLPLSGLSVCVSGEKFSGKSTLIHAATLLVYEYVSTSTLSWSLNDRPDELLGELTSQLLLRTDHDGSQYLDFPEASLLVSHIVGGFGSLSRKSRLARIRENSKDEMMISDNNEADNVLPRGVSRLLLAFVDKFFTVPDGDADTPIIHLPGFRANGGIPARNINFVLELTSLPDFITESGIIVVDAPSLASEAFLTRLLQLSFPHPAETGQISVHQDVNSIFCDHHRALSPEDPGTVSN